LLPTCRSWFPFTPRSRHIKIIHHFIQHQRRLLCCMQLTVSKLIRTFIFEEPLITGSAWTSHIGIRKEVKSRFQPFWRADRCTMTHETNSSSVINAAKDVQVAEVSILPGSAEASKNSRLMAGWVVNGHHERRCTVSKDCKCNAHYHGTPQFWQLCSGGTMSLDGTIERTSAARHAGEKLESTPTIKYRFLNLLQWWIQISWQQLPWRFKSRRLQAEETTIRWFFFYSATNFANLLTQSSQYHGHRRGRSPSRLSGAFREPFA